MSISTPPRNGRTRGVVSRLTPQVVWDAVSRASFAVLSHRAPDGSPRSSGVVYTVDGRRMLVVVARDSWKARHVAADGRVAVTVPIRRGGIMSLLLPIPPATVSFPAEAVVHPGRTIHDLPRLARLVPAERRSDCAVLEIRPIGHYVTYGLGVPLRHMREPARSRARVAVDAPTGTSRSRIEESHRSTQ
jgi:pyridoxamine 5'-phosphate oxidase-like protein